MTRVLVTSALLYANGSLHFGHLAGAYLAADCYARFERLRGSDVLFVSGSDEYGVAITMSAEKAGRTPQEHVDLFHKENAALFEKLDFSFDFYARTTWEGHHLPVNEFFHDLLANGYIEERTSQQLYSEADDKFLADRYVSGGCPRCHYDKARGDECPRCGASYEATDLLNAHSAQSGAPLVLRQTNHWYLCLDKMADQLREWMSTKNWKSTVANFLAHYIDNPKARAITRDAKWGIPVPLPHAEGKVFYVWFEACIGYISASMEWAQRQGDPDLWKKFWCDDKTKMVQFIGKDNLFFHGVFFPAMTLGQNQPYKTVDDLPANEFLNLEGRQFSKSDNWTIDLDDFLTRYSADQVRYTLVANAPETSDAEFTFAGLKTRCNAELVGKFGNLANRTLVFAKRYCGSKVPSHPQNHPLLDQIAHLTDQIAKAYASYSTRRACQLIMELAAAGNAFFDQEKPWVTAKNPETHPQMEATIGLCLECIKALAVVSSPIIPSSAQQLWKLLGQTSRLDSWRQLDAPLPVGQLLPEPTILFQKISDEQIEAEKAKLGS